MLNVRSYKYHLWGQYTVEELNGKCYKFTKEDKEVIVAEADIHEVKRFSPGMKTASVNSDKYDLSGEYTVEEVYGKFNKFTKEDKVVIVPEADMSLHVEIDRTKGGRRRNRRATKRARKSRRSYSRRK